MPQALLSPALKLLRAAVDVKRVPLRSDDRTLSRLRVRLFAVLGVAVMALAIWGASRAEHDARSRHTAQIGHGEAMLIAMLEQDTALRAYLSSRDPALLAPYRRARHAFERASILAATAERSDDGAAGNEAQVAAQDRFGQAWHELADEDIGAARGPGAVRAANAVRREQLLERFRSANAAFLADERAEQAERLAAAERLRVVLIVGVGLAFLGLGWLLFERHAGPRLRRRESRREFGEVMQVARTEREAYGVLQAELERSLPGASAVVLNRNNSANRLEPATALPPDPALQERLQDAAPDSCVAVRRGRAHARRPGEAPLLACELCGAVDGPTRCVPSLVGGEVIGSVLVRTPRRLGPEDVEHVEGVVAESAPTVAMLRSLAIAEARASTDALTGLANSRSIQDTLKRMVAHAGRTTTPLAAILFDLDHFKAVNDTYGHSAGDDVLAAVGDVAASIMRDSDFVGRYGGEEFVVLLPDTGVGGAVVVAEKLWAAIAAVHVPSVDRALSASFGIAVIPDHAGDGAALLRSADRALYAAKRAGRDRVEVLSAEPAA